LVQREGVYYGQCSEICGTNYAFTRSPGKNVDFIVAIESRLSILFVSFLENRAKVF